MRALVIASVIAAGCGGKHAAGASGPAAAGPFPGAQWVPANPTYVLAAPTLREGQHALAQAIDPALVAQVVGVDLTSPDAVAAIGVDVDGGMTVFSADVDPTVVVHLSSPPAMQSFIDQQRARPPVSSELAVDWKIENDWLWIHFAFAPHGDKSDWFAASHRPDVGSWAKRWDAARQLASMTSDLVGAIDLNAFMTKMAVHVPDAAQCARQLAAVRGVSVAVDVDDQGVGGKLAIELGSAAQAVASSVLPPPPGWAAASARAPINAQWNLDLRAVAAWAQPCMHGGPNLAAMVDQFGVRTARAFVHTLDPDDKSGTGAVAIDLSHGKYFASLLDQIPMRSKFERNRAFGAYKGKHLSVPFVATADYVLDDRVFLAAMGDGLLERAASGGPAPPPPVFALDVLPAGLPIGVWEWLFGAAELPAPKLLAARLQQWSEIHLGAHLDRDVLVIEARGNRR